VREGRGAKTHQKRGLILLDGSLDLFLFHGIQLTHRAPSQTRHKEFLGCGFIARALNEGSGLEDDEGWDQAGRRGNGYLDDERELVHGEGEVILVRQVKSEGEIVDGIDKIESRDDGSDIVSNQRNIHHDVIEVMEK
jgi:hypothetical protein